jgi:hypothetical protein
MMVGGRASGDDDDGDVVEPTAPGRGLICQER